MNPPLLMNASKGPEAASGARQTLAAAQAHRFVVPAVREMTRADTDAQRRLVRASVLAKPL